MSAAADWLQHNNEALHKQSILTYEYLDSRLEQFGITGTLADRITGVFATKHRKFDDAFAAWNNPATRTRAVTATFEDAKADFIPAYRELYGFLKHNPNVTNEDLLKMGLPARSTDRPTPAPVPATYPALTVTPEGIRRIKAQYHDNYTLKKAKPKGVAGAVIKWAVLPAAPASVAELTNSALDTKTPHIFNFDEEQRGKTVYIAAAWQNTRGEMGAWSEIASAIIP
jgi:hypothetical protein